MQGMRCSLLKEQDNVCDYIAFIGGAKKLFLLKDIYVSDYGKGTTAITGMLVHKSEKDSEFELSNNSWGKSKVVFGENVDVSKFTTKNNPNRFMLTFVSELVSDKDTQNKEKEISFIVNEQECNTEKVEGYVVFIDHSHSEIQTTGEIVYMQNYKEISVAIVILREGNTLEFDGRLVEVVNNKLVLNI